MRYFGTQPTHVSRADSVFLQSIQKPMGSISDLFQALQSGSVATLDFAGRRIRDGPTRLDRGLLVVGTHLQRPLQIDATAHTAKCRWTPAT